MTDGANLRGGAVLKRGGHPAIRVGLVLALAAVLARGSVEQILLGGTVCVALLPWRHAAGWRQLGAGLWRLKYLFLSIAVLYLVLTPGEPLWSGWAGAISPSVEGAVEAAQRVAALGFLVVAVQWLMRTLGRDELLGGIIRLLGPFRWLGLDVDRFALRLVLTLEMVPRLRVMVASARRDWQGGSPWRSPALFAARVFARAIRYAERRSLPVVTVPVEGPVPWWQSVPLVVVTGVVLWWL